MLDIEKINIDFDWFNSYKFEYDNGVGYGELVISGHKIIISIEGELTSIKCSKDGYMMQTVNKGTDYNKYLNDFLSEHK